jgi:DNA-binding SARP family transcriptional activator
MAEIAVDILGTLRVRVAGRERTLAATKQRALLAVLAVRPGVPRRREELIAALWPDSDESRGRDSLRHALMDLRRALGADTVRAEGDTLSLAEDVEVDVARFERLAASERMEDLQHAIELYRGDLAADLEGAEHEDDRSRLRGTLASAAARLATKRLASENATGAAAALRHALQVDPYREDLHRLLLRALGAAGDLAAAAAHYKTLTALLHDDLGVEPSAETRRLYASLAMTEPIQNPTVRVRRPSLEPPATLVGRRAEYGALMSLVGDAIDGRGRAALVLAEGGAGKTRLLDEIAAVADQHGVLVLRASAAAPDVRLALRPWSEALASVTVEAAGLPEPWPAVLASLLPTIERVVPLADLAPELLRTRLFEAVMRLLAHLARSRPVLVELDDLHHADVDSLHLFTYVARALAASRLTLIASARVGEGAAATEIASLRRTLSGTLVEVALAPLDEMDVTTLLERAEVEPTTSRWLGPLLARRAAGNPFFVLELARALLDDGALRREAGRIGWCGPTPDEHTPLAVGLPPSVREALLGRLATLPAETRRLVAIASVIGQRATAATLVAVSGRDDLAVAEAIAPALTTGLLRQASEPNVLAFAHELVRDAAYSELPAVLRAALHRRIATTLESTGAPDAVIARHLESGGESLRAVPRWISAGRTAGAAFAFGEAIRNYTSALAGLDRTDARRPEVLELLGDAELRRGDPAAAMRRFVEALELASDDDGRRARLAIRIAHAYGRYYAEHPGALELARDAVRYYEGQRRGAELAEAVLALAYAEYHADLAASQATARRALELGRELGLPRVQAAAHHVLIWSRWRAGEPTYLPNPTDLDRLIDQLGDGELACQLLWSRSMARRRRGDFAAGLADAERDLAMARRIGSIHAEVEAAEVTLDAYVSTGRWADAIALGEQTSPLIARVGGEAPRALTDYLLALALKGEDERAIREARAILEAAERAQRRPMHATPALFSVWVLLVVGRFDLVSDRATVERERPSCETCDLSWLAIAGQYEAVIGEPDRAFALADELERRTAATGYASLAAAPPHIRALANARLGRAAEAKRSTAEALEKAGSLGDQRALGLLARDVAAGRL